MSKREKKFPDRKPPDQRVVATITGPVGQMLGIKTKSIWSFLKCCIDGCDAATTSRGAALCPEHKNIIRRTQFGLASTRYRDSQTGKNKLTEKRILGRVDGRPSYRALMNPEWARKALTRQKNATGQLATKEGQELFKKLLGDKKALFNNMKASARAVKRHAKKVAIKKRNVKQAAHNRAVRSKGPKLSVVPAQVSA